MVIKKEDLDLYAIEDIAEKYAYMVCPIFRLYGWNYGEGEVNVSHLTDVLVDLIESTLSDRHESATHKTGRFAVEKTSVDGETELSIFLDLGTVYDSQVKTFIK